MFAGRVDIVNVNLIEMFIIFVTINFHQWARYMQDFEQNVAMLMHRLGLIKLNNLIASSIQMLAGEPQHSMGFGEQP